MGEKEENMDRNSANLIQKEIAKLQLAAEVDGLKVRDKRHILRRIEGLKLEFKRAVEEQLGVIC
jgi:hypothetical protein